MSGTVHQKFSAALDALVEQIKQDRSILAVILCGSLSHDTVWAKSDIDLVLVTIDDRKVEAGDIALYADGVNVHALLMPRTRFRETVEGSVTNSFMHSFLAKGRLLYTHDPSIEELCAQLSSIGDRDTQFQLLQAATAALALHSQGAQVVRDAGRSRLHGVVDPVRRDAARADRDHRPRPAGRSRSDAAGDDAQSGVLQGHLHRAAQHEEDDTGGPRRARRHRRVRRRARRAALRADRRVPARRRRGAIGHRNREPFHATVRRERRDDGVRVPGGSGTDRQGLDRRASDQEEQRRRAGAGVLHTGGSEDPPLR